MKKAPNVFDRIYSHIPRSAAELILLAAAALSVLYYIVCLIRSIFSDNSGTGMIAFAVAAILGIVVIVLIVLNRHRVAIYDKQLKQYKVGYETINKHYRILTRDFRDKINMLERDYKNHELTVRLLTEIVTDFMQNTINSLAETFSVMTCEKVCGCIKVIKGFDSFEEIEYKDAEVITYVRSGNTVEERKGRETGVKISENTDFREIVSDDRLTNNSFFYIENLLEYAAALKERGKHYDNTTKNWEKYYRSTIVVPIRIDSDLLFYKKTEGYDILGFLCVDSMSDGIFTDEMKECYVDVIKTYAAIMYIMFSKYQFYLKAVTAKNDVQVADKKNKNKKKIEQNVSKKET